MAGHVGHTVLPDDLHGRAVDDDDAVAQVVVEHDVAGRKPGIDGAVVRFRAPIVRAQEERLAPTDMLKLIAAVVLLLVAAASIWASDRITFQGERTVYTVTCADGTWQESLCTGRLVAGDRYTFRASRSRQEVLYWIVGSSKPSGKYTDCRVTNRGNWTCNVAAGQPATVTYEMKNDRPMPGAEGLVLPFHAVPKWKWWAIRYGVGQFNEAGV